MDRWDATRTYALAVGIYSVVDMVYFAATGNTLPQELGMVYVPGNDLALLSQSIGLQMLANLGEFGTNDLSGIGMKRFQPFLESMLWDLKVKNGNHLELVVDNTT
ncbi:hypothetical protein HOC01_04445 [archaeon]|jgi:hypothetical protein|nr:hypothetical protein [archaeon]MBT6697745.1 hypothetical protein [archaeon]